MESRLRRESVRVWDRSSRLVGREPELSSLHQRLTAAAGGLGSLVLISGEPGIGKSRLLSDFSAQAREAGWLTLTGHAYEAEGMPPYLPFIEALQEHILVTPPERLVSQIGAGAPEIALLLPDLRQRLPGIVVSPQLESMSERFRLFESVSTFLEQIAITSPPGLVLCLEDLHWADEATLLMLDHVSRRLSAAPVLIVATYRDTQAELGPALARTLEQLARRGGSQRLPLPRLDSDEVAALLRVAGRPDPPPAIVRAVYGETEGNPFFVGEVLQYLSDAGRLFDASGAWLAALEIGDTDVPQLARMVIGRRLERVSEECRRVLGIAAVIGRLFNYELLSAVADMPEEALLDAIDEAVAANLLVSDAQSIRFSHELIRQTLFSGLSLPRQQSLHLRIAAALEQIYASDLGSYLAELAGHYNAAGSSDALQKTVDYAGRAGDRAIALLAFEEALRLYGVARDAIARGGREHQAALPDILVKRAEALVALARWPEARATFRDAAALVTGARRAVVLLKLAASCLRPPVDVPAARSAATEAMGVSRDLGRPDLEAAASAFLAECDLDDGEIKSCLAQYERAQDEANDAALPRYMLFRGLTRGLYWSGRIDDAVEWGRETVAAARKVEDVVTDILISTDYGLALTSAGRYREALEAFEHSKAEAIAYGAPGIINALARAIGMSCGIPLAVFDYDRAEAIAEEARQVALPVNMMLSYVSEGIDLIHVYVHRGELDRADAMVTEVAALLHHGVGAHGPIWNGRLAEAKAGIALARNDLGQAFILAGEALELASALGRPKYEALSLSTRGKALVALGKRRDGIADLRRAIEAVRPMRDPAAFLRAAAALLAVENDAALAAEARDAVDRIVANLPDGWTESFLGTEQVRLVYQLTEPGVSRIPQRPTYPSGLSEREVEVLRLIAQGRSNPQIAEALVISVNTVQNHVSNILNKAGLSNRAEAAAYAERNDLA